MKQRGAKKISSRLWIPYQAALEYQENRLQVINDQKDAYGKIKNMLESHFNDISGKLNGFKYHPFIKKDKFIHNLNIAFETIYTELDEYSKIHPNLIEHDIIREQITELLDGKVGEPCSQEQLNSIYKIGKSRYEERVPPGYEDIKKDKDDGSSKRRYGDLIIWFQIIEKAKKDKRDIIFVTDDKKDDWWWNFNGMTIGPHYKLIQEFKTKTESAFYMYSADQFLKNYKKYLKEEIRDETIDEVHKMSISDAQTRIESDVYDIITNDSFLKNILNEKQTNRYRLIRIPNGENYKLVSDPNLVWDPENVPDKLYKTKVQRWAEYTFRWDTMDRDDDRMARMVIEKILEILNLNPHLTEEEANSIIRDVLEDFGATRLNIRLNLAPSHSRKDSEPNKKL